VGMKDIGHLAGVDIASAREDLLLNEIEVLS
jgi:hypothetical protein